MDGLAVVKRRDQRLDERSRPVESPSVTPRFQVMRLGNMLGAARAGFVQLQPQVNAPFDRG